MNFNLKTQIWLLIISYITFLFYTLGNSDNLVSNKNLLNSIAFNEVIVLYKISIAVQSVYFSYLLTQFIPQKLQNLLNKIIIFLFSLSLIVIGYFIILTSAIILKS